MSARIDQAFHTALEEGVFPAADLLVAREGKILLAKPYGMARKRTCFDIASLTKPVATATLAMMLTAEGLLKLDDTLYQWLGGARQQGHREITIRQLLNHTSGLPAWHPYYRELPLSLIGTEAGRNLIVSECLQEEIATKPGKKTLYSDIGYILLGEILEQAGSAPLDALFGQWISKPLGISDTFFKRIAGAPLTTTSKRTGTSADQHVPTPKHASQAHRPDGGNDHRRRFAPTEDCPWRERVIHGEVHDPNAYALGGVAGHAGLFSTARDLHQFTKALLEASSGRSTWIPQKTAQEFLRAKGAKPAGDAFVLGWNRPSQKNSASGRYFSASSIGHLAYTGCSIWIDLAQQFWIILLTNRIHPSSMNEKIKLFRPKIHDLIYRELLK